ncbi:MAG: SPASM domain-containing protein [bacterium]|nr:SPASM domain-containing protein [bacterium]
MLLKNEFPNVPSILPPKSQIPSDYVLRVPKWSFSKEKVGEKIFVDGEWIKRCLTLDLSIPRATLAAGVNKFVPGSPEAQRAYEKGFGCTRICKGCFENGKIRNRILTVPEIKGIVKQGIRIGTESAKFLGPADLLMHPELFDILDFLAERNIILGLFTKADLLGFDPIARFYQKMDAKELVKRLVAYPNINFLIGGRSFDPKWENIFVPQNLREYPIRFDFHRARNRAIELLCEAGMNANLRYQRMAIICSPVTAENIAGASEIHDWATERNMPCFIPPTMVSGKGHKLEKSAQELKFENDYIDLAVRTYIRVIERGAMTWQQWEESGPHPYIGNTPCNQLSVGLFIGPDGTVQMCPGNDTPGYIVHPNVRDKPLKEIWIESRNYQITAYNNGCVKDGFSLPVRFYTEVKQRVDAHFAS